MPASIGNIAVECSSSGWHGVGGQTTLLGKMQMTANSVMQKTLWTSSMHFCQLECALLTLLKASLPSPPTDKSLDEPFFPTGGGGLVLWAAGPLHVSCEPLCLFPKTVALLFILYTHLCSILITCNDHSSYRVDRVPIDFHEYICVDT